MKENPVSFQLKLNPEDFLPATEEEKQSQVIMRESVSFWKDGGRRLVKNKVAMTSIVVVILVMIFSFIVPSFYPYSYKDQIKGCARSQAGGWTLHDELDLLRCCHSRAKSRCLINSSHIKWHFLRRMDLLSHSTAAARFPLGTALLKYCRSSACRGGLLGASSPFKQGDYFQWPNTSQVLALILAMLPVTWSPEAGRF